MNVSEYYAKVLIERSYQFDAAQQSAIDCLQRYFDEWVKYKSRRSNALKKFLNHPDVPRGVYLWGGVGRGKSFLMDAFYAVVPLVRKTRLHFHEFMRSVHRQLEEIKGIANPLDEVALRIAKRYRLICFDEFHVSDIADAMILYRLLLKLFEQKVSFVMTSNYEPSTLYPDGLHRDRLLPAIALIQEKMDIVNVDAGIDYRRRSLEQVQGYYWPLNVSSENALWEAFNRLANHSSNKTPILYIEHREIQAKLLAGSIVWFEFAVLCAGPRSQNDYLELASRFHMVIVSGVPSMGPRQASEARRFTWLVDVLYDHKVKLILSAACPPESLYTTGPLAQEFQRTVSRIQEMQSDEYLDAKRRDIVTL